MVSFPPDGRPAEDEWKAVKEGKEIRVIVRELDVPSRTWRVGILPPTLWCSRRAEAKGLAGCGLGRESTEDGRR